MIHVINIRDSIDSPFCLTQEDGEKVYAKIRESLDQNDDVELDFAETTVHASSFYNCAIGRLLKDFDKSEVESRLQYRNLDDSRRTVIERVIENAVRYYKDDNYKQIVDDIINQQIQELDQEDEEATSDDDEREVVLNG